MLCDADTAVWECLQNICVDRQGRRFLPPVDRSKGVSHLVLGRRSVFCLYGF